MAVQTTDFFSKICGEKINCHFSEFYVQGVQKSDLGLCHVFKAKYLLENVNFQEVVLIMSPPTLVGREIYCFRALRLDGWMSQSLSALLLLNHSFNFNETSHA